MVEKIDVISELRQLYNINIPYFKNLHNEDFFNFIEKMLNTPSVREQIIESDKLRLYDVIMAAYNRCNYDMIKTVQTIQNNHYRKAVDKIRTTYAHVFTDNDNSAVVGLYIRKEGDVVDNIIFNACKRQQGYSSSTKGYTIFKELIIDNDAVYHVEIVTIAI